MKARSAGWTALILLLVGWIYWPAVHGSWVWDDLAEVPHNPVLSDPAGLAKIWAGTSSPDYFPLKTTVQWVEWRLWSSHAAGYHWVNLALHALAALLLWRLLAQLGVRYGWVGGLLFAVHPLAVESVAWISELKNTLSLPPLLLAMSAYVRFSDEEGTSDPSRRRRAYAFSLGWFLVALLCKSTVALFPGVLLLYDWWRRGRITRRDLRASGPFFAAALALGLVTVWFQVHRAANGGDLMMGGALSRLAGAGMAVAFYLSKTIMPIGLMPNYPRWSVVPPSVLQFLPWVALAALIVWLWTQRSSWGRTALFGLGCFVFNLAPVLGFIPMSYLRISWVADHFAYLSLAAAMGLAAAGWSALAPTAGQQGATPAWFRRPIFLGALLAAVTAAFAAESHRYAGIYRDDETFWSYAAEHNPGSWIAQNNLGLTVEQAGRPADAIVHYQAALRLNPDYSEAHLNLGNALVQSGRFAEAIAPYEWVVRMHPAHADTYAYLGVALAKNGRLPEAISNYETALRLDPARAETENNLGNALAQLGRRADAEAAYGRALQLQPDYAEAECNWGNVLSDEGQLPAAEAHYEAALRLRPNYPEADYRLANALANAGQITPAIARYTAALRLQPDYAEARANLGLALAGTGRLPESLVQLDAAVRLKPDYAEARAYYGFALAKAGRLPEAIGQYEQAVRLRPNDADIHYNLALALRAAGRTEEAQAHLAAAARLGAAH